MRTIPLGTEMKEQQKRDARNAQRRNDRRARKLRQSEAVWEARFAEAEQPSTEQVEAVNAFAFKYRHKLGGWKEHLITCWMNGADAREPSGHLLRQVRNTFGPSWLKTFRLPLPPLTAADLEARNNSIPRAR